MGAVHITLSSQMDGCIHLNARRANVVVCDMIMFILAALCRQRARG